jgi:hypothetical protein
MTKSIRFKIARIAGCLTLSLVSFPLMAQVQKKPNPDPRLNRVEKICGRDVYPDLTIKSAEIRKSDDIMVTVASTTNCNAGAFRLTMLIKKVGSEEGKFVFFESYPVQPIKAGESRQLKLYWSSGAYGRLASGELTFKFEADSKHEIKEEDEYNNIFNLP